MSGIGKWKGGARYVTGRPVKLNNDGSFPECDKKHSRYHEAHKDERKAADIERNKQTKQTNKQTKINTRIFITC